MTVANSREVSAIVPMRHTSERVPGKNYRMFVDRPLFHHIVHTLLRVTAIDRVVIDTDSPVVQEQAEEHFPSVTVLERPAHLRGGEVPMTTVLQHDAEILDSPWFLQTHSTNPLLRAPTVSRALDTFFEAGQGHDSLFSVTKLQTRLYDAQCRPLNHDPDLLLRTQDLPPVYEENSNLYLFPRELILKRGRRIGSTPLFFQVPALEAVDIDEETDFRIAEALYRMRLG